MSHTPETASNSLQDPKKPGSRLREPKLIIRMAAVALVLAAGFGGMKALASLKKPPQQAEIPQRVVRVNTMKAQPEDVPVNITGYGQATSLNVVPITAEVAGVVEEIYPNLEEGVEVPEGALLFRIDPRDYQAALDQSTAQVEQLTLNIKLLRQQYDNDRERLETLQRSEALAGAEFQRVKQLFESDQVGTQSGVDASEVALNRAKESRQQLAQAVSLYPVRIQEAESNLAAARAALDLARTRLDRTTVHAPFRARVKQVNLEAGQYVAPGSPLVTLADDSELEISVPIDSRDARSWLRFGDGPAPEGTAWFGHVEPVPCRITWTEDDAGHFWEGRINRVERFDEETRQVTLAVRLTREEALRGEGGLPLVDGMFCKVDIPGKVMQGVYRLPRWAVTFENQVYVVVDDRLVVRQVEVLRNQGEEAFISGGIQPGDEIIVTRLVNPLPNSLVEVMPDAQPADEVATPMPGAAS
jgi:RND family efflux transporter MFP subunit